MGQKAYLLSVLYIIHFAVNMMINGHNIFMIKEEIICRKG